MENYLQKSEKQIVKEEQEPFMSADLKKRTIVKTLTWRAKTAEEMVAADSIKKEDTRSEAVDDKKD